MGDDMLEPAEGQGSDPSGSSVLAATDQPVPIEVREIPDDRVPDGMRCLGTFLDGNSSRVAPCHPVPPTLDRFGVFAQPRQLVLAAREEDPGLRCELYAIVPMPSTPMEADDEEPEEPWAASVPSSSYESAVAADNDGSADDPSDPTMAAVLLGQIVRFRRDRKHPESLPVETVDSRARIVSGRVVEVVDKVLEDLLEP